MKNLPNFINMEELNRLRRKMRTNTLGKFSGASAKTPAEAEVAAPAKKPRKKSTRKKKA